MEQRLGSNASEAVTGSSSRRRLDSIRLFPPRLNTRLVERSLPLRLLHLARGSRLIEVIGPAGTGKTTVLAQWYGSLVANSVKVAWYTAAANEADPAAFICMLAGALHESGVDMTRTGLLYTKDVDPAKAVDALLLTLEAADEDIVIIIDAFDRIESADTNGLVQALVETVPERVHIVLSARRKPDLAVSSLRAQGAVQVIDSAELAFNCDEVCQLLDLPVSSPDLAMIIDRTKGWPVAVELFRMWRERACRADSLGEQFSGRSGDLADYLTEQIFSTLTAEQQDLLVDLSIFEEVEPGLADMVRGRSDSAFLLDGLASTLPGLIGCASEGSVTIVDRYHIHPLLLEYARARSKLSMAHTCELQRRAASWFQEQGRHPEAIMHARASGDPVVLAKLLTELRTWHIFTDGGAGELRSILRTLTADQIVTHPRLRVMAALAHFKSGYFREAWSMLETVRDETHGFAHDPHGHDVDLRIEGSAVELLCRVFLEGTEIDDAFLTSAVKTAAPHDPIIWVLCQTSMSVVLEMRGNLVSAREALVRSEAICRSVGMTRYTGHWLQYHHVLLALAHGEYRQAGELAASIVRLPLGYGSEDVPTRAMAKIATAASAYERRFIEEAAEGMREGLALFGEADPWFEPYAIAYPIMAEIAYRRGGLGEMNLFLQDAVARARAIGVRHTDQLLIATRAAWLIRAGELDAASELIMRLRAIRDADVTLPWRLTDAIATALALWAIARRRFHEGVDEAALMIAAGERGQRARTLVKGYILMAVALDAAGEAEEAHHKMETGLGIAAEERATAVIAEEGDLVVPLVQAIADSAAASAAIRQHASAVLRSLALGRRQLNALSEREIQIVMCMRDGASNKLIARRLGLTENTIKYHMKRIFAKLGVTSRKAALAASRTQMAASAGAAESP